MTTDSPIYCGHCKAEVARGSSFCSKCGFWPLQITDTFGDGSHSICWEDKEGNSVRIPLKASWSPKVAEELRAGNSMNEETKVYCGACKAEVARGASVCCACGYIALQIGGGSEEAPHGWSGWFNAEGNLVEVVNEGPDAWEDRPCIWKGQERYQHETYMKPDGGTYCRFCGGGR